MREINGDTLVPYSLKFHQFSLVCFLCIMFAPLHVFGESLHQTRHNIVYNEKITNRLILTPITYFDEITGIREVEAIEGQTVIIPCTVRNLVQGKVVSWIRKKDIHILTSGTLTFASDNRFEVIHSDSNLDFWGLRIRSVKIDDSGQYECQVNSEPKLSLAYQLTVSKIDFEDNSKWLGSAKILEPKELFIQNGSPLSLHCEISTTLKKNINKDVWWLHEDTQIIIQSNGSRLSIETDHKKESDNVIQSVLKFDYVTWLDGGIYTCLQPSVRKDNLKLVVVEAEFSEAMQRDFPSSSSDSTKLRAPFISIIILYFKILLMIMYFF